MLQTVWWSDLEMCPKTTQPRPVGLTFALIERFAIELKYN